MRPKLICPDCDHPRARYRGGVCKVCHGRRRDGHPPLRTLPRCENCNTRAARPHGRFCRLCLRCPEVATLASPDPARSQSTPVAYPCGTPDPTPHLPGSPDKVAALAARYAGNLPLWSEADKKQEE